MAVKPKATMAQNKLLVLYLLQQGEMELSELQIMRIFSELKVVGYFDLVECLFELTQNGHILKNTKPHGVAYRITPKGADIIAVLAEDIKLSLRNAIALYLKQNKPSLLKESQLTGEYLKLADNEYRVTLRVLQKSEIIFEINVIVYTKADAQSMVDHWPEHAVELYKDIVLKLGG